MKDKFGVEFNPYDLNYVAKINRPKEKRHQIVTYWWRNIKKNNRGLLKLNDKPEEK